MFEVGKTYTIWMAHPTGETSFTGALLKAELPFLCLEFGDGERIISLNSPAFISADRADAETAAALHQRHEARRRENRTLEGAEQIDIAEAFEAHKDDPPSTPRYPTGG
jgi:hypothetical protein